MTDDEAEYKLVYVIYRKPGMTREEFQRYWSQEHAANMPAAAKALGIKRYIQVHTRDTPEDYIWRLGRSQEEPPDGVAEVWYHSRAELVKTISTPDGMAGMFGSLVDEYNFIDHVRSAIFWGEEIEFDLEEK
jgi:uncharacterized protein (TIGR02118 family)